MEQIVYVVIDNEAGKVLGAFNEYLMAKYVAYDNNKFNYDISITPILVDRINPNVDSRLMWLNEQEVLDATQEEIELVLPCNEDEDEDPIDEDEEDDPIDEDEDESEEEEHCNSLTFYTRWSW